MEKSLRERIVFGECVSPLTTERCPVCVDRCEAFNNKIAYNDLVATINDKPNDG